MTLDQIETFVHVARTRSFSRAAVLLGLAQPTLSGRISALEFELGIMLFIRRGHTLEITDAGRALLPYAERILGLRTEGLHAVERIMRGELGHLALGTNPTCAQYLAPRLIETFWRSHPRASTTIQTALTPVLMEQLLDGAIHLALCSRAQIDPKARVLWSYREPLLLLAAKTHPLARKGSCRRLDLAGQTFLSTQTGPTHQGLHHLLPPGGERDVLLEATAGEVLTHLLMSGLGLTVLPKVAVWDELSRGELVEIEVEDAELPDYEVALVEWEGRERNPAAQAFIDAVRDVRVSILLNRHD